MHPKMFAESASYERFMGRWSRRLSPGFVKFVAGPDAGFVLDVGSGTGALSFAIASALPSAHVIGVDAAAPYVAAANAGVTDGRVRFMVGDAQHLQFAARSFDLVVSMLAMNFVPDPAKAVREMVRVTRDGGVVAAAVWDYDDRMQMLRIFWDEAIRHDPLARAKDEGNMPICRPGDLPALWKGQGLEHVRERAIEIETAFSSFDDYWLPFLGGQGPVGSYVARLSERKRAALREQLRQRLLNDGPDRAITLRARAWAVKGTVPQRR